jgi:hypothetical protein
LAVDESGLLTLPPLGPLRALDHHQDDIACLVLVQPAEGASPFAQISLSALSRVGSVSLAELPLAAPRDGVQSRLLWLSAFEWREHAGDALHIEAIARCDAAHPVPGCDVRLARSFSRRGEATPSAPEPKTARGPSLRWKEVTCAPYDERGMPGDSLADGARADARAGLHCLASIENPGSETLSGARWEIRLSPPKGAALLRVSRAVPSLAAGESTTLHLHVPCGNQRGALSLTHALGRNPSERGKNERSLRLTLEAPSAAPESLPSPAPSAAAIDPEDTD